MCTWRACFACQQLPSTADVCLLAGVLRSHDWLRNVVLDGNPIDEEGTGYLCRSLLKNKKVQRLSLNRCGLGERSGTVLLQMLAEKPGLEVEASDGNPLGEEVAKKVLPSVLVSVVLVLLLLRLSSVVLLLSLVLETLLLLFPNDTIVIMNTGTSNQSEEVVKVNTGTSPKKQLKLILARGSNCFDAVLLRKVFVGCGKKNRGRRERIL